MRLIILPLIFFLGFTSCATTRRFEATLEKWKGRTTNELIAEYGPPSDVKPLADQTRLYRYLRRDKIDPATRTTTRGMASDPTSCVTSFIVDEQEVITGWTMTGYDCRSR